MNFSDYVYAKYGSTKDKDTSEDVSPALLSRIKSTPTPHQARTVRRFHQSQKGLLAAHGVGTGKTFTSILAALKEGNPVEVVAPAPLVENYKKEFIKHLGFVPKNVRIRSYDKMLRDPEFRQGSTLILDEAHRIKNPESAKFRQLLNSSPSFKKKLLLSATPLYNKPEDIAALINVIEGKEVLPSKSSEFSKKFVGKKTVSPSFFGRLLGVQPGEEPVIANKELFKKRVKGLVDVHTNPADTTDFPKKTETIHKIPMSSHQRDIYKYTMGQLPFWARYKVKKGLPPSKREGRNMTAFFTSPRQVANTPADFTLDSSALQAAKLSPKITTIHQHFKDSLKKNKRHKEIIYSNFIGSGLKPMAALLEKDKIPYALFTGKETPAQKKHIMAQYNKGAIRALLVSSSGAEGLDTKGTRAIRLMEPHWNEEKINQIVGRGVRYQSHAHLPASERHVDVGHYLSVDPPKQTRVGRFFAGKPSMFIDEYLRKMSLAKSNINKQFAEAISEANLPNDVPAEQSPTMNYLKEL